MKAPYKLAPLHRWHQQHGGQFLTVGGWECVSSYGDPKAEADAASGSVGIRDVTASSKIDIQGRQGSVIVSELFGVQGLDVEACAPASMKNLEYRVYILRLTAERYLAARV